MKKLLFILMLVFGVGAQTITVQPTAKSIAHGDTVTFSLTATGATGYQWYRDGSPIGTSSNSVSFLADSTMNGQDIYCTVQGGTPVNSNTVQLTVYWFYKDSLDILINQRGLDVGNVISPSYITTSPHRCAWFNGHYDVGAVFFSWAAISSARNTYDFTNLDLLINYYYRHGKKIHFNSILWGETTHIPTWLQSAGYSVDTVKQCFYDLVDTLYSRYGNRVTSWEIVNEISYLTNGIRNEWPEQNAGPNWFVDVINYAYTNKPAGALVGYNDYQMNEYTSLYKDAYKRTLDTLSKYGVQLDFLGWQSHLVQDTGSVYRWPYITDMYRYAKSKYNVPIYVTEFDLRVPKIQADSAVNCTKQAKQGSAYLSQMLKLGIGRFTQWYWSDTASWINDYYPGWGYPCVYGNWTGSDFPKKSMWTSMVSALKELNKPTASVNGKLTFRTDLTCVADTADTMLYTFNLKNITSNYFWNSVNSTGSSIGLFDSAGTVQKTRVLTGFSKSLRRGIIQFSDSASKNKSKYFTLGFADSSLSYSNTATAITNAGIVTSPDFSSPVNVSGNLADKAGNITYDSVYNRAGLSRDTCKYGYYIAANGSSIRNAAYNTILQRDTGSINILFKRNSLTQATQYVATTTMSSVANYMSFRIASNDYVSGVLCTNSVARTFYQRFPPTVDTGWHALTLSWDRNRYRMCVDDIIIRDSLGNFRVPFTGNMLSILFNSAGNTVPFNGAISEYSLSSKTKSIADISTQHNMLLDNDLFYSVSSVAAATITVQPASDTIVAGQSATFFVTATGLPTYQWYRNDSLIAGATNDTFTYTSRVLPAINSKPYRDKIYCLLTTDTTISTSTVYLTSTPPQLSGSKAWQTITINNAGVSETNPHFLYQRKIPRIGAIALNVDSANDVGFTRVNDTIRIPRWVLFTTDTIYLYADIAVSSTADTSYRLQFGKELSEVNASATFSNCGIVGMWGFDSSLADYANGYTLSPTNFGGIYSLRLFNRAAAFGANTSLEYNGSVLSGRSTFTVSFVLNPTLSFLNPQIIFSDRDASVARFQIQATTNKLQVYVGSASNYAEIANADTELPQNTLSLLTVTYNGSGSTNSDKLKIYINNSLKTSTFTGIIPAIMPTYTGFVRYGWPSSNFAMRGEVDNSMIRSSDRTLQGISTSYNMLFTPSTFSTLGDVQIPLSATGQTRWDAYKSAFKSAYKKVWK